MFEHKELDGERKRVLAATEAFVSPSILEVREALKTENAADSARYQYAVVETRPVERYLPPETIGDRWAHDATDVPWWEVVNNPPHAGLVADFTKSEGGIRYAPLNKDKNVVAFTSQGEEVLLKNAQYLVVRKSDGKELLAPSLVALRKAYVEAA